MYKNGVLYIKPCYRLEGKIDLPGDKSISHRALILSSLAQGNSFIEGIQKGEDCLVTLNCMKKLGVLIEESDKGISVQGVGLRGLREPDDVLNCGNSGTTMRILSGVLAAQNFYTVLTGDPSLRRRPMDRIIKPLQEMGTMIWARKGNFPPLSIKGNPLKGISYILPVASAQVKSCILLAGLYARGKTSVIEPSPSRDHTERMLDYMGARIIKKDLQIEIHSGQELKARKLLIPGDISAAAFFIAGASILEGSDIFLPGVGINPTRTGFLQVLREMGAQIEVLNQRVRCNEEIADLRIRGTNSLEGTKVSGDIIPRLIDEIPVLAVVACFARGKTLIEGAGELRVKETDRIRALSLELSKMGAKIEEKRDGMIIWGTRTLKGAEVDSWGDHRIAMALAIAGICARGETKITNATCINVSFPEFSDILYKVAVVDRKEL